MSKTPSRCTSYSRLFSIVDYFSTLPRMPTQADRASIDSIGSLLAWMLNPLINMILMHPGGGVSNYGRPLHQLPGKATADAVAHIKEFADTEVIHQPELVVGERIPWGYRPAR